MTDNEVIAKFMGTHEKYGRIYICGRGGYVKKNYPNQLKYHNNWLWLMPVVEKITPIAKEMGQQAWFDVGSSLVNADIKVVYKRVIQFIKWYNENKR